MPPTPPLVARASCDGAWIILPRHLMDPLKWCGQLFSDDRGSDFATEAIYWQHVRWRHVSAWLAKCASAGQCAGDTEMWPL